MRDAGESRSYTRDSLVRPVCGVRQIDTRGGRVHRLSPSLLLRKIQRNTLDEGRGIMSNTNNAYKFAELDDELVRLGLGQKQELGVPIAVEVQRGY